LPGLPSLLHLDERSEEERHLPIDGSRQWSLLDFGRLTVRSVVPTEALLFGGSMYHLHAQNISRSAGHSAVKASCYRATEKSLDRRVGEEYDFTRKDRAVHSEILVPAGAPAWAKDRSELWNRVEEAEDKSNRRKSATLAKEMNMALPNSIPRDRQIAMVREFVAENFTAKGLPAQVDFHRGHKADKFKNNHAHVMVATRSFDGDQFGKKVRSIKDKQALYQWRDSWERVVNKELETAKVNERVTARSYRSRGINQIATVHVGRGPDRDLRMAENDKIREINRQAQGLELVGAKARGERETLVLENERTEERRNDPSRVGERKAAFEREFGQKRKDLERSAARERSEVERSLSGARRVLAEDFARERREISSQRRGVEKAFSGERREIFGDAERVGREAAQQLRDSQKRAFELARSELSQRLSVSKENLKTPEGRAQNATLWNQAEHGQIKNAVFKELVMQGKPFEIFGDGDRDWKLPAGRGASSRIPGERFTIGKSEQQLADEKAKLLAERQQAEEQLRERQLEAQRWQEKQRTLERELEGLKREAQPWNGQPMSGRIEAVYRDKQYNHIAFARDERGVLWEGNFGKESPGLKTGDQVTWDASKSQAKDKGHDRGDDDMDRGRGMSR
jgi:hypothetical protein